MTGNNKLLFATSNIGKFREAVKVLEKYGLEIEMAQIKRFEIQSDDLVEIAKISALFALEEVKNPVIVEDAGLFIEALNLFPGPYSSYVYKTIRLDGILKLMENVKNRQAYFMSAIAYCKSESEVKIFKGRVDGTIIHEKRGEKGFGFDPIFCPKEGDGRTFAEMSTEEKSMLSHRGKSFKKLATWIK
ncbi:MAG: XTP/dITP diphosphatase [Candidatus Hodarchaeota archaeon]